MSSRTWIETTRVYPHGLRLDRSWPTLDQLTGSGGDSWACMISSVGSTSVGNPLTREWHVHGEDRQISVS